MKDSKLNGKAECSDANGSTKNDKRQMNCSRMTGADNLIWGFQVKRQKSLGSEECSTTQVQTGKQNGKTDMLTIRATNFVPNQLNNQKFVNKLKN